MVNLELVRTLDETMVNDFMLQDEIWDTFTDDLSVKDSYAPDFSSRSLWLMIMIDGIMAGLILVENANFSTLRVHPYLLKPFRRYVKVAFDHLFRMFLETPEFINKMIVSIPFCRKIVYNTAIKTGFIEEGVNRQSFLKDGVFYDQWDLGLTKNEIRCLV